MEEDFHNHLRTRQTQKEANTEEEEKPGGGEHEKGEDDFEGN